MTARRTSPYWLSAAGASELREFLKDDRFEKPEYATIRTEMAVARHRHNLSGLNMQSLGRALGYADKLHPIYLYEGELQFLLAQEDLPETLREDLEA